MTADQGQRDRAIRETERSFAVEASAGTGKTSTLVGRILHLVLEKGPAGPPIPLSSICAITFTEKAAGEMKVRLRNEFEKFAAVEDRKGEYARDALSLLETASISTFHAFAVSLLKERPIEAGLDPRFTTLDALQSNLLFLEVWESWINRALLERQAPLENALRKGTRLDQVRDLADILRVRCHLVRRLKLGAPPSSEQIEKQLEELRQEAPRLLGLVTDSSDLLVPPLEQAIAWLRNPSPAETPPGPGTGGKGSSWKGGRDTVARVKDFIKRVGLFCTLQSDAPKQRTFHELVCWLMDGFLSEWEARKRSNGYLDFDDQVEMARRLLASGNCAARSDFQKRYQVLLVDEFQDTDMTQLEIVMLLSDTNLAETNLTRLRPDPGRLFIVGDPKQSIYRFRGADIETYLETVDEARIQALDLERLELTANFRSVPSILRFVDTAFSQVMKREGHYQSEYLPFGNAGNRAEGSASPSVYILGDRTAEGELAGAGGDFDRIEAGRIARLITQIRGSQTWKVEEPSGGRGVWREAGYGDIAILVPVLSRVEKLEIELRAAGIPYVLEGGKFYYARSEVASAVSALRAVANPNDQVALYSALRSIFFGLSDEDLLRARIAGLPLDYRAEFPTESPLNRPCAILHDLHLRRHERSAAASLEALLARTGAREVLCTRGFQSLANLGKLSRQLRSLQEDLTFSEVVSLLATIDEEEMAESESRLMEERSDAVRILTIHKAKGLDFRIVILACAGVERGQHAQRFLADAHSQMRFALKIGSQKDGWRTPGWDELKEEDKKREDAELLRLLYVALTRARDHLVISTHHKGARDRESGIFKAGFRKTRLAPIAGFLTEGLESRSGLVRFLDTAPPGSADTVKVAKPPPAKLEWAAVLRREYESLDRLVSRTPQTSLFQSPAQANEGGSAEDKAVESARTGAIRMGVAFHEAMESLDFRKPGEVARYAQEAGVRHRLDGNGIRVLEDMMQQCLHSSVVERCRQAVSSGGKSWRELPYLRPLQPDRPGSGMEEGKIDLLFEEQGSWVIVDYKTDSLPQDINDVSRFFREKYAGQIAHYAKAMSILGLGVKEAYLLLARTGMEIGIPLL